MGYTSLEEVIGAAKIGHKNMLIQMVNLLKQLKQLVFHLVMNNNSKKKFLDETLFYWTNNPI